jgi:hypothetical protein
MARKSIPPFGVALALLLLAGCASSSQGVQLPPATSAGTIDSRWSLAALARTGLAPQYFALLLSRSHASPKSARLRGEHYKNDYKGLKDLYVGDRDLSEVVILKNKTYTQVGTISDTSGVDRDYLDSKGNLYVANTDGNIAEYAPGASSPSFTYSADMDDPIGVNVDTKGNVYEVDYQGGFVNEYAQKTNSVLHSCLPGGSVEGVAIDASKDVFVVYYASGTGKIAEYKNGLSGCNETVLGATVGFPGGMVLDKHGNLLVCDQSHASVDVIDPPYSSITGTLGSGFGAPVEVTLNKANALAFVTDSVNEDVQVLDYPSGSNVTTLDGSNGLEEPWGAVDGPNAVY